MDTSKTLKKKLTTAMTSLSMNRTRKNVPPSNSHNYQDVLNVILIFIKLYIQSFETCSQSHSIVIKTNKYENDSSYDFLKELMGKGIMIPQSHTLPFVHNTLRDKRALIVKNLELNNSMFYQCLFNDFSTYNPLYCTMIKKYAKYYIYSPIQEKQYDKSIKSKLFFLKMETSHTYSLEHLSNAIKTYTTKQTYKNCNTINTDTIERIENCEHSTDRTSEEDDDDDATTVSSVSNNKKTCKLYLPDPLFVEIQDKNYNEPTRAYIQNEIAYFNFNNRV